MSIADQVVLVVEDTPHFAQWQIEAVMRIFPDMEIRHVETLLGAHEILNDPAYDVYAVMTDNGYPLVPGGERLGSKSKEGGAGTLLIKQIRAGMFGEHYQDLPVSWHTARISEEKRDRATQYDHDIGDGLTRCFEKGEGVKPFQHMATHLVH